MKLGRTDILTILIMAPLALPLVEQVGFFFFWYYGNLDELLKVILTILRGSPCDCALVECLTLDCSRRASSNLSDYGSRLPHLALVSKEVSAWSLHRLSCDSLCSPVLSPVLAVVCPVSSPLTAPRKVDGFSVSSAFYLLLGWCGDLQAPYTGNQKLESPPGDRWLSFYHHVIWWIVFLFSILGLASSFILCPFYAMKYLWEFL